MYVLCIRYDLSAEKLHYNTATLATIRHLFLIRTVEYFTVLLEYMDVFPFQDGLRGLAP